MRHNIICVVAAIVVVTAGVMLTPTLAQQDAPARAQDQRDKLSYGVGYYLGREVREGLNSDGIEPNAAMVIDGFRDGFNEIVPDIPAQELDEILYAVHRELQDRMVRELLETDPAFKALAESNLATSLAFMEEFAKGEGVIALDNGILYRPLESGDGRSPNLGHRVVVSYVGNFADGTVFAEADRAESPMRTVTEGASIVLQMMREGDRWEVVLPPDLAYGVGGDPPLIGPNQALHFVATLHEIK